MRLLIRRSASSRRFRNFLTVPPADRFASLHSATRSAFAILEIDFDMAVGQARWRGVRRIYLLTASASDFFAAKFGYRVVDRSTLGKAVSATETFSASSGAGRVAMRLDL